MPHNNGYVKLIQEHKAAGITIMNQRLDWNDLVENKQRKRVAAFRNNPEYSRLERAIVAENNRNRLHGQGRNMSELIKKSQNICQKPAWLFDSIKIETPAQNINISIVIRLWPQFRTRKNVLIGAVYIMTQSKRFVNSEKGKKEEKSEFRKCLTLFGERKATAARE